MKAEDVWRLHDATKPLHARHWDELSVYEQAERIRFARACEQHGIERAKSGAAIGGHGYLFIDWSALDAEIAKENGDVST